MLPYIGILVIMAYLGFIKYFARWDSRETAARMAAWVMFGLWLLLALRSPYMGIDLGYRQMMETGYLQSFHIISSLPLRDVFSIEPYLNYEFGYKILNALVGWIWENEQFFLAVCAAISMLPVALVIQKDSSAPMYSCLIYFALPLYELLFSALRQGIAVGLCFFALSAIEKRKPLKFIAIVLMASTFHSTALLFLAAYPIYHLKMHISIRLVSIAAVPVLYLMRYEILNLYAVLFRPGAIADNNGALGMLILLCAIYLVCCFFCGDGDPRFSGYLNLLLVCCMIQTVANIHSTAMRAGYPYMIPLILLIPKLFEKMEWRLRVVAKWTVVIFFTFFAVRVIYSSTWSCMYPYIPFWEEISL